MSNLLRILLVTACGGGTLAAQSSLIFCTDTDEFLLDGASGLIGLATHVPDEALVVVPTTGGTYSARPFVTAAAQFAYIGDMDADGRWVDASVDAPGQDNDEFFIKRFTGAPAPGSFTARDLYFSKENETDFGPSFRDADVFRYAAQGVLDVFLSEAVLQSGLGTVASVDLDGICQSATGDLFISLSDASIAANGPTGPLTITDGDILHFPVASISYSPSGNVTAIAANSVIRIATEIDVNAMITSSAVLTSVGGAPSITIDLSALEIDPSGGTWVTPQGALTLPNLIFAWEGFSNDGAIISTSGGGAIATINGVSMGSTSATTGTQLGLLPDSTGIDGINGMALINTVLAPVVVENYPVNLITSSTILYTEQQVSGATPGGNVVFFFDVGGTATGGSLTSFTFTGPLSGQVFGTSFNFPILSIQPANSQGYARLVSALPNFLVGSGTNLAFQALDVGKKTFALPAGMQFL